VLPILTPAEMAAVDAAAPEPTEVLVARAGAAVARAAVSLLGGRYGRRVAVICGKGNNGADGRVAARRLAAAGLGVSVVDAAALPATLGGCDLVVDAAFGTGFRGSFHPPDVGSTPVLAVDLPSGIDGLSGRASGTPLRATATVTFAALKPGLLFGDGPEHCGRVEVADIGLPVGSRAGLVRDEDVAGWWPERRRDDHKWRHACWVVAGSPGMGGAAVLASRGAARGGAGYVRLSTPGGPPDLRTPPEVVGHDLAGAGWDRDVVEGAPRFGAVVVGPGLGRRDDTVAAVVSLGQRCPVPLVVDGDALWALATDDRPVPAGEVAVLTPHDGEYARLAGSPPGEDRIDAARRLAERRNAVVLLKGPTTVVAAPDRRVAVVTSGDARLATAGSGDVLAGLVGALLAQGLGPFEAAASAAHVHGATTRAWGRSAGLVSDDLPELLPAAIASVRGR
jgi:NAD(P)H-hydrate epimerase